MKEEETPKTIKLGLQYRDFTIDKRQIDEKKRTVELSFSSEEPVERYWGVEILDHQAKSVNLRRLKRGGALLIDHDMGNQVGVIEKVWVDEADRKGRAIVRFGRSAKAEEIFQDVVDEIRSNVSVGYRVDELILEKAEKDGLNTYRAMPWEPYEISLVSVPADISVGVGRNEEAKEIVVRVKLETPKPEEPIHEVEVKQVEIPKEGKKMTNKCERCKQNLDENGKCPHCELEREIEAHNGKVKELSPVEYEQKRIKGIKTLCTLNHLEEKYADMFIAQGKSLDEVADDLVKILAERDKAQPKSKIGMVASEVRQFSITRAIRAIVEKDWAKIAPFELECSRAVEDNLHLVPDPMKFHVPYEVLEGTPREKRDVSVGASGGAYLVATDNVGFIDLLRNRSIAFRMGATRLPGLVGNVTIPKQSAAGTAYWLTSETNPITESQLTIVQVALSPKNVGAYTEISRQLLLQSVPAVEGIVTADLAAITALAVDVGVLRGSGGSGQPQGIVGSSGVGSVTGTSLAAAGILEFMTDVAGSNVTPARPGYVTTSAVAGLLMARPELPTTGTTRLWLGNIWDGSMFGIPAMSSEQMLAATMLFGAWEMVIVGEWGVLEVEVNPYADFKAGIIGIRTFYTMDVALRWGAAFSYATSIT